MKKKKIMQAPPAKPKKMRTAITLLMMSFLMFQSCQPVPQHDAALQQTSQPVLVVHMNDYSLSTEPVQYFDTAAGRELYEALSVSSGVIKHIGVYSGSFAQDILTIHVKGLDTTSTAGLTNVYQRAKVKARNQRIISVYQKQAKIDIAQYITEISKPHIEKHTDLAGAMSLAVTTLAQSNYSEHKKYLLISSDLKDCPAKGQQRLKPVQLSTTTVLLIRPALSADSAKALFTGAPVYIFTSASDAVSFITHNQNQ